MEHARARKPVVIRWIDWSGRVWAIAQITTIEFCRQCAGDFEIELRHLLGDRAVVALEEL